MNKDRKQRFSFALDAIMLVGELGFAISIPIVLGVLVGIYMDKRMGGTGLILTACILAGIVAGIYNAYRILSRIMDRPS